MNKKFKITVKVLVTIILLYVIFKKINISDFLGTILTANIWYFVFACLLWPICVLLSSFKWNLILQEYGINISHMNAFNLYWMGSFFNNFLPSSFGGDSYKFVYLNKTFRDKKAQIVSSILLERGIGFLVIIMFTLFLTPFFITNHIPLIYFLSALILTAAVFIIFSNRNIEIRRIFKSKLINKIIKGVNVLLSFKNKKKIVISIITSSVFLMLGVFSTHLVFLAFDRPPSFLLIMFLYPLITLSGLIPFSINSLGIKEGIGIYLYSSFGIDTEVALSVLLVGRVLSTLCTATGGLKYLTVVK